VIIHPVTQGSPEWLALRCGIPTASCFDQIVTPKGKPSSQAERYMHTLLAERIMGHPAQEIVTGWMDRGSRTESEAVAYYEGQRDLDTERIGFLTNNAGTIGASPDRFVGADGLLEIKVPREHTHVGYLLTRSVDAVYYPQVQGQLWISERTWLDILSYHPEMPPALIRVERDEAYIATLAAAVGAFAEAIDHVARANGWTR
jgi:YqaJ-like viral recombinase domain